MIGEGSFGKGLQGADRAHGQAAGGPAAVPVRRVLRRPDTDLIYISVITTSSDEGGGGTYMRVYLLYT